MIRVTTTLLLLVFAVSLAPAQGGGGSQPSASELNSRGLELMDQKKYQDAVDCFAEARRLQPEQTTLRKNHAMALNALGVTLSGAGKFNKAVETLIEADRIAPGNKTVRGNLVTAYANWGVTLMDRGRFGDADYQFKAAEHYATESELRMLEKRRSQNYYQQARKFIAEDDSRRALSLLEKAAELYPENVPVLIDLATLYYQSGDSESAMLLLEAIKMLNPDIKGLDQFIARVKREMQAEAEHDSQDSQHFSISYEGSENRKAADDVLQILSRAYRDVGSELNAYPSRPIHVVLYTREKYSKVTLAPDWAGAIYDGKIRVPISGRDLSKDEERMLERTLRHEYTHAVVHVVGGLGVPIWLNEGLAMYYETDRKERERQARNDRDVLAGEVRMGKRPSVSALPSRFTSMTDHDEVSRAYMVSRAFVYWMADEYREARLERLLEAYAEGKPTAQAIKDVYNKSLEELEALWLKELER